MFYLPDFKFSIHPIVLEKYLFACLGSAKIYDILKRALVNLRDLYIKRFSNYI